MKEMSTGVVRSDLAEWVVVAFPKKGTSKVSFPVAQW